MLVDFSTLKLNDLSPIYQQIIRFIKIKISLGEVASGDELPSRRMLSVILNVNPNTIQKCCKIMENDGFLISQPGAKSVLSFNAEMAVQMKQMLCAEEVVRFIDEMIRLKLQKDKVLEIINTFWSQGEQSNVEK